ncbi:MAG: hypothetical protein DRJ49_06695 [Thermoprotei archaeon]|nr:MAG: hypothetical protein DRJ49_06695 [Thermoprotei archaeon]
MYITKHKIKLRCPICRDECSITVDSATLTSARESPSGIVGLAIPHGDHVVIVYIDSKGRDRGVRAYRTIIGETIPTKLLRLTPDFLQKFAILEGFRISLGMRNIVIECFNEEPTTVLSSKYEDLTLEVLPNELNSFKVAAYWMNSFLRELYEAVHNTDFRTLMKGLMLLDSTLTSPPTIYTRNMFKFTLLSGKLSVVVDRDAGRLFMKYLDLLPWLYKGIINKILESNGTLLLDLIKNMDSPTMKKFMESLLFLERRGVVRLEVR